METSSASFLLWPDFVLIGVVLVSSLLAVSRGFTREVLTLLSWGISAVFGFFAAHTPGLLSIARAYVTNELASQFVTGIAVFLATLLVTSLINMQIASLVLRGPIGTIDRTLGLFYGAARGLLLVVIVYFFYGLFVPQDRQHPAVVQAYFFPVVQRIRDELVDLLPLDLQRSIRNMMSEQAKAGQAPPPPISSEDAREEQQRKILDNIIEDARSRE